VKRGATIAVVLVVAAGAAVLGWRRLHPAAPPPAPPVAAAPAPPPPPAPPVAPPPPAIQHPLPPPAEHAGLPALDDSDPYVKGALVDLLGRKAVATYLRLEGAIRRFVATVNNLATDDASASLWPVHQAPGTFLTETTRGGALVISQANTERYVPFVRFVTGIDARRAASLYFRLYPLLQRAYEDLGFPGKYLNDRVVAVIDNLLATPKTAWPIAVRLATADGGASSGSGLYLYDDPALETATAGQKILLRMGPDNEAKLMAKLVELRAQIATKSGR
jgi:hypothetical protein